MDKFFMLIGVVTTMALAMGLCVALYCAIAELIDRWKWKYRYKHRFDKPPTAECYCIDCKYHDNDTNRCWRFGETTKEYRCTADNWFCWEAEPRKGIKEEN